MVIGKIMCFFGLRLCLPAWNNIVCITELACQTYSHDSHDLPQVVLQLWDQELQRKWDLHLLSVQTVPAQLEAAEIYGDKKQRGEKGSVLALVLCNFQEEECRF